MKKNVVFIIVMFVTMLSWAQWEPDQRLTNAPDSSRTAWTSAKAIASAGDIVHLAWSDKRDGNWEIYYKNSVDGGLSWGADSRLTNDSGKSTNPAVCLAGSFVHLVWQDDRDGNMEIYYVSSTDGGLTWGSEIRQTNNSFESYCPSVASSDSMVQLVWTESNYAFWEVHHKKSTDGGLTWGSDKCLSCVSTDAYNTSIAISGSNIHVVWNDARNGNPEIYYKKSSNGGMSFGADIRLTNNPSNSIMPSISASGSAVYVVWYDLRDGNFEIYFKRSNNEGVSWGTDTRLTNNPGTSYLPNVSSIGWVVNVVWCDDRDGNNEIYYKRSENGGLSWDVDARLTNNVNDSQRASVSISGLVTHVVWYDNRDGNEEIYYKRNPTGGGIVSIKDHEEIFSGAKFDIFPNPASNTLHLKMDGFLTSDEAVLTIHNVFGETVLSRQLLHNETEIDISSFPVGYYLIRVLKNGQNINTTGLDIVR